MRINTINPKSLARSALPKSNLNLYTILLLQQGSIYVRKKIKLSTHPDVISFNVLSVHALLCINSMKQVIVEYKAISGIATHFLDLDILYQTHTMYKGMLIVLYCMLALLQTSYYIIVS